MKFKFFINIFKYFRESIINKLYEKSVFHFLQEVRKTYSKDNNYEVLTEFKIFPKTPKRLYPSILYKKNWYQYQNYIPYCLWNDLNFLIQVYLEDN